jgi:hypothetical protein
VNAHLDNAAQTLRRILADRHPQHSVRVEIHEADRHDTGRVAPIPLRDSEVRFLRVGSGSVVPMLAPRFPQPSWCSVTLRP